MKALDKLDTFISAVNEELSDGNSSIKIDGNGTSDEVSNQIKELLTKLQDVI